MKRPIAIASSVLLTASVLIVSAPTALAAHKGDRPVVTDVRSDHGATVGFTHVIIKGSHFTGTPKVTFGSAAASNVRVLSSHTLAAYAPGHRHGTVHVRVTTKAGTSRRSEKDRYTYIHQVTPGSWHARTAPVPAGEPTDDFVGAVTSCPTTTVCYSVGAFGPPDNDAAREALISTRVSGHFTTRRAPLPPGAEGQSSSLSLISCPAVGSCVAAGSYDNGRYGLLLVLAHGTWTASTADPNPKFVGLSCGAPGECLAIGRKPVLLRLHDGSWTRSDIVPPDKHGTAELHDLDCASASYCLAAGTYAESTNAVRAFIVQVVNGKQTVRPIPNSPKAASPKDGRPTGVGAVQCPAVGRCTLLVGFALGKDASDFVTVQNGSSFAFRPITLPADADSNSLFAYGSGSGTSRMSCPEVSVCFAASVYEIKGLYIASVARLDHAKVHFYNLPRPDSPREDIQVRDIDCAKSTACTAVGAADLVGKTNPVETVGAYFTFANGVWAPQVAKAAPGQKSMPTGTDYNSVVCPAAGACTADGTYGWDPELGPGHPHVYLYAKTSGLVSIETPN